MEDTREDNLLYQQNYGTSLVYISIAQNCFEVELHFTADPKHTDHLTSVPNSTLLPQLSTMPISLLHRTSPRKHTMDEKTEEDYGIITPSPASEEVRNFSW